MNPRKKLRKAAEDFHDFLMDPNSQPERVEARSYQFACEVDAAVRPVALAAEEVARQGSALRTDRSFRLVGSVLDLVGRTPQRQMSEYDSLEREVRALAAQLGVEGTASVPSVKDGFALIQAIRILLSKEEELLKLYRRRREMGKKIATAQRKIRKSFSLKPRAKK